MEILVPLGFFVMIAAIIIGPGYLRSRNREKMLETLRVAYEKGQPVPPELIDAINTDPKAAPLPRTPRERADNDLRRGIMTLAVALAFVVFGWAVSFETSDAYYPLLGMAAFPGFIGLALITFGLIGRNKSAI